MVGCLFVGAQVMDDWDEEGGKGGVWMGGWVGGMSCPPYTTTSSRHSQHSWLTAACELNLRLLRSTSHTPLNCQIEVRHISY